MKLGIVLSTQAAQFSALAYKGQLAENAVKINSGIYSYPDSRMGLIFGLFSMFYALIS